MTWWRRAFPLELAEEGHFSRREFARFLALVSAGFTTGIGLLWLRKKPLEGAPDPESGPTGHPVALGLAADLRPGQSRLFKYRDAHDACILLRTGKGELKAYRQTCTHLGCAVRYSEGRLECPCHMGYFETDRGFPVQGPPTRPLSAIALEERPDGTLWAVGELPKPALENLGPRAGCVRESTEAQA
ncbi:MAG: Rieske 2Fe-2S domain-containing protein [Acidobacteria bacterium]|nr:Rieske 2Fe-2S domain-containing protein [Acidobacteriota bacterium]MBI3487414.1 Rieske 2Fe-2S domain-containing protein [Acidobacteriota bacterium]